MLNKFKTPLRSEIVSDENLQLITGQIFIGQAVLSGYRLGLFKLLLNQALSMKDISLKLAISERSTQALVTCTFALNISAFFLFSKEKLKFNNNVDYTLMLVLFGISFVFYKYFLKRFFSYERSS